MNWTKKHKIEILSLRLSQNMTFFRDVIEDPGPSNVSMALKFYSEFIIEVQVIGLISSMIKYGFDLLRKV